MSGLMSVMAGEAWDGAADRLVNEIAGIRGLLALAGKTVTVAPSTSVKVSDLKVERAELAKYLIALQMSLEAREDDAANPVIPFDKNFRRSIFVPRNENNADFAWFLSLSSKPLDALQGNVESNGNTLYG